MRLFAPIALLALAACGEGGTTAARPQHLPAPPIPVPGNIGRTMAGPMPLAADNVRGKNATALIAQFGRPRADVQEGPARKLQFAGSACVLDIYLYPRGRGEAIATHLDTRLRDGRSADPASCVAALRKPN